MSKKKNKEVVVDSPAEESLSENLVQISLTNVLAAIIKNMSVVAVPMRDVVEDYSKYNIAMSLDDESNMIIFELVEQVEAQESQNES